MAVADRLIPLPQGASRLFFDLLCRRIFRRQGDVPMGMETVDELPAARLDDADLPFRLFPGRPGPAADFARGPQEEHLDGARSPQLGIEGDTALPVAAFGFGPVTVILQEDD